MAHRTHTPPLFWTFHAWLRVQSCRISSEELSAYCDLLLFTPLSVLASSILQNEL